jgi:acetyl-CoA C-acetyltransferase
MEDIVIIDGVRTPIGRFGGKLRNLHVADIGAMVVRELLTKTGINEKCIEEFLFAIARQAGFGPNPARTVAVRAGLPIETVANSINHACASGLSVIMLASQMIRSGDRECIMVAGGEIMSKIPYFLMDFRWEGHKLGNATIVDGLTGDALKDPLCGLTMGETVEVINEKFNISREEQDIFAYESHMKANRAWESGFFKKEAIPVNIPQKKGEPIVFYKDEGIRPDTSIEKLSKLPPAFKKDGTLTAGNSCQISDGASSLLVMSRKRAEELGLKAKARIVSYAIVGLDPVEMGLGPVPATIKALEKAGLKMDDIDLIELNEAFAAQVLCCIKYGKEKGIIFDKERLNIHGGAIAMGHPTGDTGIRIVLTLMNSLHHYKKRYGLATLCVGGGQGAAVIIERE